jgi:hypothetical protein
MRGNHLVGKTDGSADKVVVGRRSAGCNSSPTVELVGMVSEESAR